MDMFIYNNNIECDALLKNKIIIQSICLNFLVESSTLLLIYYYYLLQIENVKYRNVFHRQM